MPRSTSRPAGLPSDRQRTVPEFRRSASSIAAAFIRLARGDGYGICAHRELDAVSGIVDPGQELEREALRAEMSGDPLAPVLRALVGTVTTIDRSMADIARQIEQSRQPVPPQLIRQAVAQTMPRRAVPRYDSRV